MAGGGGNTTLAACLEAFFASEDVTWSCEAESGAAREAAARTAKEAVFAFGEDAAAPRSPATPFAAATSGAASERASADGSQSSMAEGRLPRGLLSQELGSETSAVSNSRKVRSAVRLQVSRERNGRQSSQTTGVYVLLIFKSEGSR